MTRVQTASLLAALCAQTGCFALGYDFDKQPPGEGGTTTTTGGTSTGGTTSTGGSTGGTGGTGGTTTTGGTSGSGGAPECMPGTSQPCYEGDPATLDVGVCKAGFMECSDDGHWGDCVAQVLPSMQTCPAIADLDCDGCICDERWFEPAGTIANEGLADVAADGCGTVVVAGYSAAHVYVALLSDFDGSTRWSVVAGSGEGAEQAAVGVDFDPSGDVVVAGTFTGELAFNGVDPLNNAEQTYDGWVARLDRETGDAKWTRTVTGTGNQLVSALTSDSTGAITVAGSFEATAAVNSPPPQAPILLDALPPMTYSILVVQYDSSGTVVWAKQFGNGFAEAVVTDVASGPLGEIVVTGAYKGVFDFGSRNDLGPTLTNTRGGFVLKLDALGDLQWARGFGVDDGDMAGSVATAAAIDSKGDVAVTGLVSGAAMFDVKPLTSTGATDALILKLDAMGTFLWGDRYGAGANASQEAWGVAINSLDQILVTGNFDADITFGAETLSVGFLQGREVFLAKLASTGQALNARMFDVAPNSFITPLFIYRVDVIPITDEVVVAAPSGGAPDWVGTGPENAVGHDIFAAKLSPDGEN